MHIHSILLRIARRIRLYLLRCHTRILALVTGSRIGRRTIVEMGAELRLWEGGTVSIGEDCCILEHSILWPFWGTIRIGNCCSVNPYSVLYGHGGLTIGNNVRIATHVVIIPANHNFDDPSRPISTQGLTCRGIQIDDDVWIGTGARILDGVHIGHGCVIASGAVVTRDTTPYGVYGGVPARLLKRRDEERFGE